MKISTKGRYALTLMIYLGEEYKNNRFVSLKEVASNENISLKYLEKIVFNLKKKDFFLTATGKDGGYKLKRDPPLYSIGEIIRAASENLDVVSCVSSESCPNKKGCRTFLLWEGLTNEINNYLDNRFLSDYL